MLMPSERLSQGSSDWIAYAYMCMRVSSLDWRVLFNVA
jgi:hypothetical protein